MFIFYTKKNRAKLLKMWNRYKHISRHTLIISYLSKRKWVTANTFHICNLLERTASNKNSCCYHVFIATIKLVAILASKLRIRERNQYSHKIHKMERFTTIANGFYPLTIVAKLSTVVDTAGCNYVINSIMTKIPIIKKPFHWFAPSWKS